MAVSLIKFAPRFDPEHSGPERADWICNALPGDVEGRSVDRLEHRGKLPLRIEVRRGRNADRTRQRLLKYRGSAFIWRALPRPRAATPQTHNST